VLYCRYKAVPSSSSRPATFIPETFDLCSNSANISQHISGLHSETRVLDDSSGLLRDPYSILYMAMANETTTH